MLVYCFQCSAKQTVKGSSLRRQKLLLSCRYNESGIFVENGNCLAPQTLPLKHFYVLSTQSCSTKFYPRHFPPPCMIVELLQQQQQQKANTKNRHTDNPFSSSQTSIDIINELIPFPWLQHCSYCTIAPVATTVPFIPSLRRCGL